MLSWFDRIFSSPQLPVVLSAVISGITVAGVILCIQTYQQKATTDEVKASASRTDNYHLSRSAGESNQKNEDNRAARLAVLAQNGDYDPGMYGPLLHRQ